MTEPVLPMPSKPPVSVKVLRLQSVQIRVLLGKAGGTIREIISKTGADIKIDHSKRDDPEGDVTIIGNVDMTEAVIREVLASKGCPLKPPEGTAPKIPAEEHDLVVAPDLVGLFIGKGGENIKEMREKVGGAIFIGVQPPTGPGIPQTIQIVGDNREKAKEVVREKLAEINAFAARLHEKSKGKGKSGGKNTAKGEGKGMKGAKGKSCWDMMGAMMDMSYWDMMGWGPGWDMMGWDPSWDMGWGMMGDGMGWDMGWDAMGWDCSGWNGMGGDWSMQGGGAMVGHAADGSAACWPGPAAGPAAGKGGLPALLDTGEPSASCASTMAGGSMMAGGSTMAGGSMCSSATGGGCAMGGHAMHGCGMGGALGGCGMGGGAMSGCGMGGAVAGCSPGGCAMSGCGMGGAVGGCGMGGAAMSGCCGNAADGCCMGGGAMNGYAAEGCCMAGKGMGSCGLPGQMLAGGDMASSGMMGDAGMGLGMGHGTVGPLGMGAGMGQGMGQGPCSDMMGSGMMGGTGAMGSGMMGGTGAMGPGMMAGAGAMGSAMMAPAGAMCSGTLDYSLMGGSKGCGKGPPGFMVPMGKGCGQMGKL